MPDSIIISDGSAPEAPPEIRPATPEEQAQIDAFRASQAAASEHGRRAEAFATAEDAERLAIVNERAQTDPAYAALAELALRGRGEP